MIEQVIYQELCAVYPGEVYPIKGSDIPCVVYTITPISDGVVKQSQLEVRIIAESYGDTLDAAQDIVAAFSFSEKKDGKTSGNITFRGTLSGGGVLFDDNTGAYEHTLLFILKWR